MSEPNLHQLRIFAAVARLGSFSKAARELNISQPAVSVQVQELEKVLGTPLLQRLGRKIVTTEAGRMVLQYTSEIFSLVSALTTSVSEIKGIQRGTIQCGVCPSIAESFLPILLAEYQQTHPSIAVQITIVDVDSLGARLANGELTLAFAADPPIDEQLAAMPFGSDDIVVIAPAGHRYAQRRSIPVPAMRTEKFIVREVGSELRRATDGFAAQRGLEMTVAQEMHSTEAIKSAVVAGLGVAFLPRRTVRYEVAAGDICVLDIPDLVLRRTLAVLLHKQRRLTRGEQAFVDLARLVGSVPAARG